MRKFIKKYYIQLITIIILVILIIIMLSQSFNMKTRIKEKSKELKQTQLDYALANTFLDNSYEFKKNSQYIENNREWLSIFLPNDDDKKVKLFSTLEQLAKDTGNENITLAVANTTPKTKQKKATKNADKIESDVMNIDVTLVGGYNDLVYFLQKIENMNYFADVTSVNINKTAQDTRRIDRDGKIEGALRDDLLQTNMKITFYLDK